MKPKGTFRKFVKDLGHAASSNPGYLNWTMNAKNCYYWSKEQKEQRHWFLKANGKGIVVSNHYRKNFGLINVG
jgi:hypothetical protein